MRESGLLSDEDFQKKIDKIKNRKERHEQHKKDKQERKQATAESLRSAIQKQKSNNEIRTGDTVRIKGLTSIGKVETIDGKQATVIFGDMRTKMQLNRWNMLT